MRAVILSWLILAANAAQAQQVQPKVGYSTEGLADPRQPWELNWRDPENEWVRITSDSLKAVWFIQLASDLRASDQPKSSRRVWLKVDYSKQVSEPAREAKALWSIDCDEQRFAVRNMTWYSKSGEVQETRSYPASDIIPGSIAATVARRVCSQ